ncbi:multidrug-efflux transporter [marine gamma proteobacterium HTCC2143]|jgi:MFS family permease|uniref:Multidrug-efflux transporter n=1 Tax=marine gamma proteobacterium HTCC2143 TaxID=247633 RepID=A0Y7U4_9GAMM|nr:multidrug-efflux transporter [marine gamma proteobacterium HTCC2143]
MWEPPLPDSLKNNHQQQTSDNHSPADDTSLNSPAGKRAFILLWCTLLFMGMGQSLVFSTLPPIARSLGMTPMQISLMFGVSAVCWVFMSPKWGRKSDTWGRKPAILIGFAGFAISMVSLPTVVYLGTISVLPVAWMWPLMIVSRAIFGIFGSANMPASQAWVAERSSRADRTKRIAAVGAAFGVGNMLGPGIGSLLAVFGMLTPFYVVTVLAVLGAVAIQAYLPENAKPPSHSNDAEDKPTLKLTDERVLPFLILAIAAGLAHATQVQAAALYFQDMLHLTVQETQQYVGIGLMAGAGSAMFAQMVLVQKLNPSPRSMIYYGLSLTAIGYTFLIFADSFSLLITAMMVTGMGLGLLRPGTNAAASLSVSHQEQGAIAGIMGGIGAAGHIMVPFVSMNLYAIKPEYPFIFTLVLILGIMVFAAKNSTVKKSGMTRTAED